jgi:hypothetical protein
MGIIIESAANGNKLLINEEGRALVEANSARRSFFISRDDERVFNSVFLEVGAVAGEYVGYFKNTSSSRIFVVDVVRVEGDQAAQWLVHKVTGAAPTGDTVVIPVNMNFGSGITAEADALAGNVLNLSSDGVIASDRHGANQSSNIPFDDTIVMPPDTEIAFEYEAGAVGPVAITMRGYYEDI